MGGFIVKDAIDSPLRSRSESEAVYDRAMQAAVAASDRLKVEYSQTL